MDSGRADTTAAGGGETNKVWYLKQNRLFEDVPEGDVERNAGLFTMKTFARKASIFDQSDPARTVYMIKRGGIRIARLTADGKEVTVAVLGQGDIFGEESLFAGSPRTTFAVALEETLLCQAHAEDLFSLLKAEPQLALNVAKVVSDRLVEMTATVEDLAYAQVSDRLMHLLRRLALEHGRPVEGGVEITVRLTHADIASLVGSTRETVSLELARLVRAGRLRQRGQTLIVPPERATG
jgi:CRP/FNR family transcriptional regulator, cyclic AMP receptor protein